MHMNLNPVVLSLGPLAVRWFGLLALIGLVAGLWLTLWLARRSGVARPVVLDALAWGVPAGILGAHAVHVLGWWDAYLTHPADIWRLDVYSLSAWGGIASGGLVVRARLRGRDVAQRRVLLDAAAAGLSLAVVVASVGALIEGAGQGVPTDLPWATSYDQALSAAPEVGIGRHPLQVYDALACGLAFGVALALARASPRGAPPGVRGALFLALYAGSRVMLGPLALEPSFLFGLQLEQMVAGACMLAAVIDLGRIAREQPQARTAEPAAPGRKRLAA